MSLYKINTGTLNASNAPTFIPAGIHTNLRMVDIKYGTTEKGNEFLAFYFENEKGDKLSHTEWPPKPSKPISAMSVEEKRTFLEYNIEGQMARLKQIIEVFKKDPSLEADNFKELAMQIIAFLGDSYKDKLIRVKVVYDNKGFTTLPKNARNTFIESADIAEDKSSIRQLPSDKFERPNKGDVEKEEFNPLETTPQAQAPVTTDVVPF
jgi:hypothetical protein